MQYFNGLILDKLTTEGLKGFLKSVLESSCKGRKLIIVSSKCINQLKPRNENSTVQLFEHQKGLVEAVCWSLGESLGWGVQVWFVDAISSGWYLRTTLLVHTSTASLMENGMECFTLKNSELYLQGVVTHQLHTGLSGLQYGSCLMS